jgi:hypothetical protein
MQKFDHYLRSDLSIAQIVPWTRGSLFVSTNVVIWLMQPGKICKNLVYIRLDLEILYILCILYQFNDSLCPLLQ